MINTRNTTQTALVANSSIPVGAVVHKNCKNVNASGTSWTINGSGYFKIIANITIEPTAVADMTITLNSNGVAIASASETPAVAGDAVNLTLIGVVLDCCKCNTDTITLSVNSAGTLIECDVIIERM